MEISKILISPNSNQELNIDWDKKVIKNLDTTLFEGNIQDDILSILPKSLGAKTTDLHQASNSSFDYKDHYIKDAETFDYFQEFDDITENERLRLNQFIISKINKNNQSVLDVGCGSGWLSKMLNLEKNSIVSLDISHKNVRRVLKERPHKNHSGIVSDVFNLPFKKGTFDVIVASEIIEHVYDPELFINSLLKVLKTGGKLIISTPYNEKIPLYLCVHCNRLTPRSAHLHSFNETNIESIINTDRVSSVKIDKLTNNILLKLRFYWMSRFLPFKIWRIIDKLAILFLRKPTRLVVEIKK